MDPTIFGIVTIVAYLYSSFLILKSLHLPNRQPLVIYTCIVAAISHGAFISINFIQSGGFSFRFLNTASLVALLVVLLLLVAAIRNPVEKLGIILFPIAALMLLLNLCFPDNHQIQHTDTWQMNVHILTSIFAFSFLNIAAFQALCLSLQNRQLKSHHPYRFILSLPALQTMENLLFQTIIVGLFFLSFSLLTGVIFIENLFAQHLAHKTVLSILAWFVFSGLLAGRMRYGWRGQTAIRWTLFGFVMLLLAYFGSKLVLEIILQKV